MCGRFTQDQSIETVLRHFPSIETPKVKPRYNLAPSQPVLALRLHQKERGEGVELTFFRWGLIPSWAKDSAIGNRLINARSETVFEKPAFRKSMKSRRCLIPAGGFYEWQKVERGRKQPYFVRMRKREGFALAGLWERWENTEGNNPIETCAILTTAANSLLQAIHERMPVIIDRKDYERWLDPKASVGSLLKPFPQSSMEAFPVTPYVNSPSNDDIRCTEPIR